MPVVIHPHLDGRGLRRSGAPQGFEALGRFLEQDVQSSVEWCDELFSLLTEIEQGALPAWGGTGNAFTLTLTRDAASLQCEFDDARHCSLSLAEFRAALQSWRHFIVSDNSPKLT